MLATVVASGEAAEIPAAFTDLWWSEFLRSPGFAGLLAVGAALVTLGGVAINNRANRAGRARDRWWEMYRWLMDETATFTDRRATMVLEALTEEATTAFEKQLVAAATERLVPPEDEEEGSDERSDSS